MVIPHDAGLPVLELKGIGKEFGAIRALHGVDLRIAPGEVVGLMGDNGAGKSTLVKIIAGNFPPTHGEIRFDGRAVHFVRPIDARAVGIEVVYQDLALADNLTAAANEQQEARRDWRQRQPDHQRLFPARGHQLFQHRPLGAADLRRHRAEPAAQPLLQAVIVVDQQATQCRQQGLGHRLASRPRTASWQ